MPKDALCELHASHANECLPDEEQWIKGSRRKQILSSQEVEQLVTEAQTVSSGCPCSINDANETLNEAREKQLKDNGQSALNITRVCRTTVDNHKCIAAICDESAIVNKAQQKIDRRHTAETSLLSTLCYLMTV